GELAVSFNTCFLQIPIDRRGLDAHQVGYFRGGFVFLVETHRSFDEFSWDGPCCHYLGPEISHGRNLATRPPTVADMPEIMSITRHPPLASDSVSRMAFTSFFSSAMSLL